MLSIELRQSVSAFASRSDEFKPLYDMVRLIADHYEGAANYILGHADGGEKLNQAAGGLQAQFSSLSRVTKQIVPRKVYKALEDFKSAIEESFDITLREHPFVAMLIHRVESFVTHYDEFLMHQSAANSAKLMLEASHLNRQLASFLGAFDFIAFAGGGQVEAQEDETSVSLVLYETRSFQGFVDKLRAFQDLYSELCAIVGVSEAEHPIRIEKIESGSLWIKVFGETKVTQLVVALVESTAGYLHRRFTAEGQIASVPRKLESLDAAIQVSEKLQAIGVDTTEMNEYLRKGGVAISKSLATLLEDQPRVSINERVFSVGERLESLMLAQRATLLLTDRSGRVDPNFNEESGSDAGSAA